MPNKNMPNKKLRNAGLTRREMKLLPAEERIKVLGYRGYVGGTSPKLWYEIGKLQYHFLIAKGLLPSHQFLDVGCGSLRLGQFLIPYLEAGHYTGLEPEAELVETGMQREFYAGVRKMKAPHFIHNFTFDFEGVSSFDYAIAQSVFTHLTHEDIELCFTKLALIAHPESVFYATYFLGDSAENDHDVSHANRNWNYRPEEIAEMAPGWSVTNIGNWQHPRDQQILECKLAG